MKDGEKQQANRFWSAKFLGAQQNRGTVEQTHLMDWLRSLDGLDTSEMNPSYKLMAVKCAALFNMSKKQVHETMKSNANKGNPWLCLFLEQNGLSREKLQELKDLLKTDGSEREFFESLAQAQRKLNRDKFIALVSKIREPFADNQEKTWA